jgi:hypothetical protein
MLLILNPDYRDHANAFIKGIIKKRGIHAPGPDLNYMAASWHNYRRAQRISKYKSPRFLTITITLPLGVQF